MLALFKPGKAENPSSCRPIAILSMCYKPLDRLLYYRTSPLVEELTIPEQAGFRSGRSSLISSWHLAFWISLPKCSKNLLHHHTFIFDLLYVLEKIFKLQQVISCKKITSLIQNMFSYRRIIIYVNERSRSTRTIKNGLPERSVLAPFRLNVWKNDVLSIKEIYLRWRLSLGNSVREQQPTYEGSSFVHKHYIQWCLKPQKLEISTFHRTMKLTHREVNVTFGEEKVRRYPCPTCLRVTVDRSLTYKQHLKKTHKIKLRNNILGKVAGPYCGLKETRSEPPC